MGLTFVLLKFYVFCLFQPNRYLSKSVGYYNVLRGLANVQLLPF